MALAIARECGGTCLRREVCAPVTASEQLRAAESAQLGPHWRIHSAATAQTALFSHHQWPAAKARTLRTWKPVLQAAPTLLALCVHAVHPHLPEILSTGLGQRMMRQAQCQTSFCVTGSDESPGQAVGVSPWTAAWSRCAGCARPARLLRASKTQVSLLWSSCLCYVSLSMHDFCQCLCQHVPVGHCVDEQQRWCQRCCASRRSV
jgi:hypothetical protein